jgi:uncharacterized membrane protein YphA (DoxX/SURF4 family)
LALTPILVIFVIDFNQNLITMKTFKDLKNWINSHNPKWLVLLRVVFGFFLIERGVTFLSNIYDFNELIKASELATGTLFLAKIVPWIHILGGFCIIIGLSTRIACLIQIPFLIGALFLSYEPNLFKFETTKLYTIILLIAVLIFAVEGGGKYSLTGFIDNEK